MIEPSKLCSGVPPELEELCLALLECTPTNRPDARDIVDRLFGEAVPRRAGGVLPTTTATAPEFVGRQAELEILEQAFCRVEYGASELISISGESGIGKTALAAKFAEQLTSQGRALVLSGTCFFRAHLPFNALDGMIDVLASRLNHMSASRLAGVLDRQLPSEELAAAATVFPVLRLTKAIDRIASTTALAVDVEKLRLDAFEGLRKLLSRLSDSLPLVIILDNLQWGDRDSARLLRHLLLPSERMRILWLGCHRTAEGRSSSQWVAWRGRKRLRPRIRYPESWRGRSWAIVRRTEPISEGGFRNPRSPYSGSNRLGASYGRRIGHRRPADADNRGGAIGRIVGGHCPRIARRPLLHWRAVSAPSVVAPSGASRKRGQSRSDSLETRRGTSGAAPPDTRNGRHQRTPAFRVGAGGDNGSERQSHPGAGRTPGQPAPAIRLEHCGDATGDLSRPSPRSGDSARYGRAPPRMPRSIGHGVGSLRAFQPGHADGALPGRRRSRERDGLCPPGGGTGGGTIGVRPGRRSVCDRHLPQTRGPAPREEATSNKPWRGPCQCRPMPGRCPGVPFGRGRRRSNRRDRLAAPRGRSVFASRKFSAGA